MRAGPFCSATQTDPPHASGESGTEASAPLLCPHGGAEAPRSWREAAGLDWEASGHAAGIKSISRFSEEFESETRQRQGWPWFSTLWSQVLCCWRASQVRTPEGSRQPDRLPQEVAVGHPSAGSPTATSGLHPDGLLVPGGDRDAQGQRSPRWPKSRSSSGWAGTQAAVPEAGPSHSGHRHTRLAGPGGSRVDEPKPGAPRRGKPAW